LAKRRGEFAGDLDAVMPHGFSPQYEPRKRFLRVKELQHVFESLPKDRAAHVAFIVATGARAGEAIRAERGDVDFSQWQVRVRGTKTKKSARTVPIAPLFRALRTRALRDAPKDRPLFRVWGNNAP